MRLFYDLHIHSCLSPCGDTDMTPGNIVGMAALCGLQIIALSDHNTCRNTPAFAACAERAGLLALPAMELTTREEIHVLCLLPALPAAAAFSDYVYRRLPDIRNDEAIFGAQLVMDAQDTVIGREPRLLTSAADIGIYDVAALATSYGGVALPAHVDRPSFSLFANLGFFDPAMGFTAVEISAYTEPEVFRRTHPGLEGLMTVQNSDAHELGCIQDAARVLDIRDMTPQAVIAALRRRVPSGPASG
ncbi:MAG: PHP domain-containing protein [Oscillospiraceae bacterium]|jgi:PHP family Zn ribbon phosphoesterase|nr:PHP domain-containing protein [Oscillospiraceae bacterium]